MALQQAKEELEDRVAERTEQLKNANLQLETRAAQLRALAGQLTLAEQRERRRIAMLLHDNLQQILVGAKFQVSTLHHSAEVAARAAGIATSALLDEAIQASRSLTAEISPPILYEQGLVPALRWLVDWIREKHGLAVELNSEPIPGQLTENMIILLFESVREVLFNVVKHASVDRAQINVGCANRVLHITILDHGSGFDVKSVRPSGAAGGGYGLFSIRERLGLLGGRLEIDSAPGRGTRVMLSAPAVFDSPSPASEPEGRIRLLLVDDHPVMREGLTRVFAQEPDIEVVGEASDGGAAIELAAKLIPDVVLMDVNLAALSGVEATRLIRERLPQVKVVGLSMFDSPDVVQQMLAAGASAHLCKSLPTEEIVRVVRTCSKKEPQTKNSKRRHSVLSKGKV